MEIQSLNLVELTLIDSKSINGGDLASPLIKWFRGTVWGIAIGIVVDNWDEIKAGAVDGWNDAMND